MSLVVSLNLHALSDLARLTRLALEFAVFGS